MLFFKSGKADFFLGTSAFDQKAGAKVLLFFDMTKFLYVFFAFFIFYIKKSRLVSSSLSRANSSYMYQNYVLVVSTRSSSALPTANAEEFYAFA